jgi:hypothetical protein
MEYLSLRSGVYKSGLNHKELEGSRDVGYVIWDVG